MEFKYHKTARETVFGAEFDLRQMSSWAPTVAGVRDCILQYKVTAADLSQGLPILPEAHLYFPRQHEVEKISELARGAVIAGRVIDFGNLPNAVLKQGGDRGGPLWNMGGLGVPFRDPWLLYHTWEGGVAVYLVQLMDKDKPAGGDVEVCELQPVQFGGDERILIIGDRGVFDTIDGMLPHKRYHVAIAPAMIRFVDHPETSEHNNGGTPQSAAAGNIGDPLMTALLILNTRNVERETVRVNDKLQRARAKSGKTPIPPYDRVNTAPYVTAILQRGKARPRGEALGGHHASPAPHLRMGHPRTYASGVVSFIRDTLVGVNDETRAEFLRSRSHYAVAPT